MTVPGPTHYDVLGVRPDATPDEVRQAYLRRARALHPDRTQGPAGDDRDVRAMQDVNEAWRVLGDRGRRAAYDNRLAASTTPAAPPSRGRRAADRPRPTGIDPDDVPYPREMAVAGDPHVALVRGLPWIAIAVVLVAIFVFTAFAGGGDETPRPSQLVGRCVDVGADGGPVAVPCQQPNDGRVDLVVTRGSLCPTGSTATPMPGDRSWLCLRPADDAQT